jgi:hypothetical protein
MRRPTQNLEPGNARWRRRTAALTAAGLLMFGAAGARADDPLDDTDGTEDWDQVAPAASQPAPPVDQDDFREEIAAWQAVSQQWEQARLQYIEERARHKRISAMPRVLPRIEKRPVGYQPDADINDDNYNSTAGDDGDWGDPPGATQVAPSGSLDRAIDSELEESGVQNRPAPAATQPGERARPADAAQPARAGGDELPSAFRAHPPAASSEGGLAPTSGGADDDWEAPPAAKPDPKAVEAAKKREAEARAKAERDERLAAEAAEKARRKAAEEDAKRQAAEAEARRDREAAEGAAAAARFLQEQAERERKEAEALRKKAALEEDEEGQVVDPEIKKELGDEEEEKPEED